MPRRGGSGCFTVLGVSSRLKDCPICVGFRVSMSFSSFSTWGRKQWPAHLRLLFGLLLGIGFGHLKWHVVGRLRANFPSHAFRLLRALLWLGAFHLWLRLLDLWLDLAKQ